MYTLFLQTLETLKYSKWLISNVVYNHEIFMFLGLQCFTCNFDTNIKLNFDPDTCIYHPNAIENGTVCQPPNNEYCYTKREDYTNGSK